MRDIGKIRGRWIFICMLVALLAMLAGCSKDGEDAEQGSNDKGGIKSLFTKKQEHASDTPWNHGTFAIMETEYGWYTHGSGQGSLSLRYYDKESGDTILVCNKPECQHQFDDQCVATYKGLSIVNSVMYEGAIYVLGYDGLPAYSEIDNGQSSTVNLSLYKVALDGSSIDRVGTVIEVENPKNQKVNRTTGFGLRYSYQSDNSFIIHKGVAYISFLVQLGDGMAGIRGGGLMKMDLATGKTEQLYEKDNMQKGLPAGLVGVGDYVYYFRSDGSGQKTGWYRYHITEGTTEQVEGAFLIMGDLGNGKQVLSLNAAGLHFSAPPPVFTEDRIYNICCSYDVDDENGQKMIAIMASDAKDCMPIPEETFETEIPFKGKTGYRQARVELYTVTYYDGMFLIADEEYAYLYDKAGKSLGKIMIPKEELEITEDDHDMIMEYKISDGKLYLIFTKERPMVYKVFFCPLDDILQGKGAWTFAYEIQGRYSNEEIEELNKLREEQGIQ